MTRLVRSTRIDAPENVAIDRIKSFFSQHTQLHVKTVGPSTASVDVQFYELFDWLAIAPHLQGVAFAWRPSWRGFPEFGATLTVRPSGDTTELVLDGTYEPPGGFAGRIFDRLVGRKLAERTMDAFLQELALREGDG